MKAHSSPFKFVLALHKQGDHGLWKFIVSRFCHKQVGASCNANSQLDGSILLLPKNHLTCPVIFQEIATVRISF